MNKICTSIDQSKKLIELGIDVNTADMTYVSMKDYGENTYYLTVGKTDVNWAKDELGNLNWNDVYEKYIPAWSLTALLDILAKETHNIDEDGYVVLSSYKGNWWNISPINCISEEIKESNNPLDATFEIVVWLFSGYQKRDYI